MKPNQTSKMMATQAPEMRDFNLEYNYSSDGSGSP